MCQKDGSQGNTIGIFLERMLRMDFKRHVFTNFDRIMGEKTIFVIKSKDFHVEMPFFLKKKKIFLGEVALT